MTEMKGSVRNVLGTRQVVEWKENWPDWPEADVQSAAEPGAHLRLGNNQNGTLVAQHFAAWTPETQLESLQKLRKEVLAEPTAHLNLQTWDGLNNTLMVLRFLHDFEVLLEKVNKEASLDLRDQSPCDDWAALEIFCRPWVLMISPGVELLRIEEFVPPSIRALCAGFSPFMVPLSVLVAWVTVQSPKAFCQLHLRRILGPRVVPWRVQLDGSYQVRPRKDMSLEAVAAAILGGGAGVELVHGVLPELAFKAAE
eukprot:CAMPEP_0197674464 /NCGR_PEP_ID=MMETSP1338-20131121/83039_1 /TAXON_ID=43686 ORGANISM="Pelagodinium beii, Strain RCC1491" /NCGR_SAMPLE_ID=MMETSP1338 /ASSEMBLY_ACC=CAM_ASM_000754 /LENGTH=253 /DNA_ID=CAMNT_0043254877 /DNA_START=14 /DNA_END=773 /DNA_ORIENTATION=+